MVKTSGGGSDGAGQGGGGWGGGGGGGGGVGCTVERAEVGQPRDAGVDGQKRQNCDPGCQALLDPARDSGAVRTEHRRGAV